MKCIKWILPQHGSTLSGRAKLGDGCKAAGRHEDCGAEADQDEILKNLYTMAIPQLRASEQAETTAERRMSVAGETLHCSAMNYLHVNDICHVSSEFSSRVSMLRARYYFTTSVYPSLCLSAML